VSGSAHWYEAIYNRRNTRKPDSDPIIFPNVTSFNQRNSKYDPKNINPAFNLYFNTNYLYFGGTQGDINASFSGNIGEILVYNNFLDPTISSVYSLYNQNVLYLKKKWNI
jgi:hypothetical protein